MIFAQTGSDPNNIIVTLGLVGYVVGLLAAVSVIWGNFRRRRSFEDEFVSKEQCRQRHEAVEKSELAERATVKAELTRYEADRKKSSEVLHGKIETLRKDLTDRVDAVNRTMDVQFQDVNRSLGRIEGQITKLRENGGGTD